MNQELMVHVRSSVVFAISDHWTRVFVQYRKHQNVFGAILGRRITNGGAEFVCSFEVNTVRQDAIIETVDEEYFNARLLLLKEILPDLEFLGFYTTGDHSCLDQQDECLQKQAAKFCKSPGYLLKFNPSTPITEDKISLSLRSFDIDPSSGAPVSFEAVPWKVVSDRSEQIGVGHASLFCNLTLSGGNQSAVKNLSSHFGAAKILVDGLTHCSEYVEAVQSGKIVGDPEIVADIHKISEKLSAKKSPELENLENQQTADQKLTMLLTTMTGVQGNMANLITKLNLINSDRFNTQMGGMKKHLRGPGGMLEAFMM